MNRNCWLLVTPMLLAAGPASNAEIRSDIRCMLALGGLAQHSDPAIKMAGMLAAQYYFGRVDSRLSALDLEQALVAESATLTDGDIAPLLKSCGEHLQTRGAALSAIGKRLQDKAARAPAKSS